MSTITSPDAPSAPLAAARVVLRPKKALPFYGRHPWVRDSAVERVEPTSLDGEHFLDLDGQVVDLVNEKGKFIARGFYNSQSRIRVRLYSWSPLVPLDEAFFRGRMEAAVELRRRMGYLSSPTLRVGQEPSIDAPSPDIAHSSPILGMGQELPIDGPTRNLAHTVCGPTSECILGSPTLRMGRMGEAMSSEILAHTECGPTSACRLVFSEADGLSGLVVDRYGEYLVVQVTSLGMAQRLEMIVGILRDLLAPKAIVLRTEKSMAQIEGVQLAEGKQWGQLPDGPLEIHEHGLKYQVDLHEGQKTGLYLDQRENRKAAASYVRGGRVLDMFSYTGGFTMCAAALGGASEVLGIDTSKRAVAQARANAAANNLSNVRFDMGDGFQTLDALLADEAKFDVVILDPPKFARSKSGINQALMAYHRLNRSAIGLVPRGGILVTCSCSGGVTQEDFQFMLSGVAQKSGREIQILEQRGASPDHPIAATCLETEYLKCFICRVV